MKQAVAFFLLLAIGITVLWQLEARFAEDNEIPEVEETAPPVPEPDGAEVDGVSWKGAFEVSFYEENEAEGLQRIAMRLESDDSISEEGRDRLRDVRISLFDTSAEVETSQGTLQADDASLERLGESGLRPEYTGRVQLSNLRGTVESLFEGVGFELTSPKALLDASDPTTPTLIDTLDPSTAVSGRTLGDANSVAVSGGIVAVAIAAEPATDE